MKTETRDTIYNRTVLVIAIALTLGIFLLSLYGCAWAGDKPPEVPKLNAPAVQQQKAAPTLEQMQQQLQKLMEQDQQIRATMAELAGAIKYAQMLENQKGENIEPPATKEPAK